MKAMKEHTQKRVKRLGIPAIVLMIAAVFSIPLSVYAMSNKAADTAVAQGQKLESDTKETGSQMENDAEEADGEVNDDVEETTLAGKAVLTETQAKDAAIAAYPDATFQEAEIGDENGTVIFEVKMKDAAGKSLEVNVDATNGKILPNDSDNDGENAND